MNKTAAEIAEYILFKIAMQEEFEKAAFMGVGGNWAHVWKRLIQRFSTADRPFMKKMISDVAKKVVKGNPPNGEWHRAVYKNGKLEGYVLGTGKYVSTVFHNGMKPRGTKWG